MKSIAIKNDFCRKTFLFCRVVMTPGVCDSPNKQEIIEAVRTFEGFNEDNDPYNEHDFGAVTIDNIRYYFKFDYFDESYKYYKEDGNRVLTIMRADEY